MNNQQAFDTMVQHLRKQGQRSRERDSTTCAYRGADGLKCAVGALIPDEIYNEEIEGKSITRLLISERNTFPELSKLFEGVDEQLLDGMQNIHDYSEPNQWEYNFKSIAEDYNLNYTAPEGTV
jgi:hypothetical protein